MPEGKGNSRSEHGSVGKGNGTNAAGNRGGGAGGVTGGGKKAGNATVADHMIATGGISVPSIGPKGVAQGNYPSQDDAYTDFSRSIGDYATRSIGGKIADYGLGPFYNQQEPISQNPRTFSGGTYHTSANPVGMAGAIASLATGVPFGGAAGSLLGDALGIPHISYGGYDQPDTGAYSDPRGGWGAQAAGSGAGASQGGNGDSRMGQGGALRPAAPGSLLPQSQTPVWQAQSPAAAPTPVPQIGAQVSGQYVPVGGGQPYGATLPTWFNRNKRAGALL